MEKPYYTTIVAFATPSGRLHIGHALGQVAADVTARYEHLSKGKQIFYPLGIHSTGRDLLSILTKLSDEGSMSLQKYGISDSEAKYILSGESEQERVSRLVEHFKNEYEKTLTNLGIELNMGAFFSTDDPNYEKYVQWTLRKLDEVGLVKEIYSPRPFCAKCNDLKAIEQDFSEVIPSGKINLEDVRIQEGVLIFFRGEHNELFPVYTTRPETIFGVTNLYYNPTLEYARFETPCGIVICEKSTITDILSSMNCSEFKLDTNILCESISVRNPVSQEKVPLIPANFVRNDVGTGFVMAVPFHDPFDAFYANDNTILAPRPVIFDGLGQPISFMLKKDMRIDELESLRIETYGTQERGFMGPLSGKYSGLDVITARTHLINDLTQEFNGIIFHQIVGGKFFCRMHPLQKITVIRKLERSIDYSNTIYQERVISSSNAMRFYPESCLPKLREIFLSRKAKPCERRKEGNVGSISPFDSTKKIEALSDSNIYMEYYVIALAMKLGLLKPEELNDSLFDYLYLDKKSMVPSENIASVKDMIEERYPIDLNVMGAEHLSVHAPFSLFNHAAILPEKFFPREYMVTATITRNGEKMSKSKGNVLYIDDLVERLSHDCSGNGLSLRATLDTIRFFLMNYQSLDRDFDWSDKEFELAGVNVVKHLVRFIQEQGEVKKMDLTGPELKADLDMWLSSRLQRGILFVSDSMESRRYRSASIKVMGMIKDLQLFDRSMGKNDPLSATMLSEILRLLSPFTPNISHELHMQLFNVPNRGYPFYNSDLDYPEEHDYISHKLQPAEFEKEKLGMLNKKLRIAEGRKIVTPDTEITVIASSEYTLDFLKKSKIRCVGKISNFVVGKKPDEIKISCKNETF